MAVLLRVVIGLLVAAAVAVAVVPMLVILDLNSGGTGWGLCSDGIENCRNSYFAGFEMLAIGTILLFVLIGVIRVAMLLLRKVEEQHQQAQARQ